MQSRFKDFQDTVDRLCNIFTYVHIEGQKDKKLKKDFRFIKWLVLKNLILKEIKI